jgi:formate dehydrogenase iron-sulfur subunit
MVAPAPSRPPLLDLVDELLAEQGRLLTPVVHAARAKRHAAPDRTASFRTLLPLSAPGPGEQYAFEVDLDACSGCKACVAACHALNGLDDDEAWRDTGLLLGGSPQAPVAQTVTSACHHCADPGCLHGCPVLAYEKDPATGIVRHLDDQCIGCQYCILKCPYDVPKYNPRLGIVRKCDLCHQRLAAGEAPACAQACPTQAIRIVTVAVAATPPAAVTAAFLPGAPDPRHTRPTTRYLTRRALPADLRPGDANTLRPQPGHHPLAALLVLVGWAVALQALQLTALADAPGTVLRSPGWPLALGALGLGAATFHLGRPERAWRVFLGWRRSWFSREALLLGAWLGTTAAALALPALAPAATLLGALGFTCSIMIYADTPRRHWRIGATAPRFCGSALTLALAATVPLAGALALLAKLALIEARALTGDDPTARLLHGPLAATVGLRTALGVAAIGTLAAGANGGPLAAAGLALAVAGELVERHLFFRAVDPSKMPGYPSS